MFPKTCGEFRSLASRPLTPTARHIIGPMTAHQIHPDSARQIEAKLVEWAARGINRTPETIQLVTFTLKYNRMHWLTIDGMKDHWEEARVTATPIGPELVVSAKNVSGLTIRPPKSAPRKIRFQSGELFELPSGGSAMSFVQEANSWKTGTLTGLRKQHGLQGPIDDAFMDSFLFVTPSGACRHEAVDQWVKSELGHAVTHWRQQMRGDAIVKGDSDVTDQDIASSNLVLWGDPQANRVLQQIAGRLPIRWSAESIAVDDRSFDAKHHALIVIYPNPLNPSRYVVLNSGFTYREYDYLNNARQTPKLPDWAVVDVRVPANSRFPGKVVDADFFGEQWELKPPHHQLR
jgi:hypothetical protein